MSQLFKLPDLGEGLPDAEIHEWFVKEGDHVKMDQPLVAMETAKAVVDVPAPQAGKIIKLHGKVGDVVAVGAVLVEFENLDKVAAAPTVVGSIESSQTLLQESLIDSQSYSQASSRIKATPLVRSLAKQLNVDLSHLAEKIQGPITAEAVKAAAGLEQAQASPASMQLSSTRRFMAQNLSKIHAETVPVTLIDDADIHHWQDSDKTLRIVRAIQVACKEAPKLNAHFKINPYSLELIKEINLGLAIDTPEGLFVPVIHACEKLSDNELRQKINEYKEKAKANHFSPEELKGASIILSNFGSIAGRYANPMLVPPAVAIIGVGKSRLEPLALDEKNIANHLMLPISFTFDHRAATGGEAARFLHALITALQK
jgi:pyruvate dehydrogenase E2 component (dihydrolipoamide acetyltransferase)